ncbi:MAG: hypothetical protein HQL75_07225 [Magnetococcales bacterium]|nr:hypothetical protein [Magnetococcales bacterium]
MSWSWRGRVFDIIPAFEVALSELGLSLDPVKDGFYRISSILDSGVSLNSEKIGVYTLSWLDPESTLEVLKTVYGKTASVQKIGKVVIYFGSDVSVSDFLLFMKRIDRPLMIDVEKIPVRHVSVKIAMDSLGFGQQVNEKGEQIKSQFRVIPDYWNTAVLVFGSPQERMMARATIAMIDKPGESQTKIVWLHNLDGEKAKQMVTDLGQGVYANFFGRNGLLLSGPSGEVDKVSGVIAAANGSDVQIRVQATIAQISDSSFASLGASLGSTGGMMQAVLGGGGSDVLSVPGSGIFLGLTRGDFSGSVSAESWVSDGEVLSSPILTVLNGQVGKILVGQTVPFLGAVQESPGGRDVRAVTRENVGVSLEIRASVEREGVVLLVVKQEVSSVAPESIGAVDLITDKKSIETTVLVPSGQTLFLGGLKSKEVGSRVEKVPILGDIPIFGEIFTSRISNHVTRNLVVSLRPEIIDLEARQ